MNLIIVIPTYNRVKYLQFLITQIKEQINLIELNYIIKIVVVIDGSTDGTDWMLENEFPEVYIINGNGNWWYTKSVNEGMKYAINKLNADYILALNDDIQLQKDYTIEVLSEINICGKNSIIGSLSLTLEMPHRITSSGIYNINKFFGKTYSYHKYLQVVDGEKLTGVYKSVLLSGRGMLIPAEILVKLNYFDENFPQYHSDSDFCLRAIEKGFQVYINWDAKIYNHHKMTSQSSSYIKKSFAQLLISFFDKHSRNHIGQNTRYLWRHYYKPSFPILFAIFIFTRFRSYFKQFL